jgi:hypothetical protein
LPVEQPNPSWFGAAQLYVSAPSLGINNAYLGQHELTGLETGRFHELSYTLPAAIRSSLNGTTYSDLRFTIALNVPSGGTGVYYVDNLDVGPVSRPQQPPLGPFRSDLVGTSNTGAAALIIDTDIFTPPITGMGVYVTSVDGNCVPSEVQECRFIVPYLFARVGGFEIGDETVSEMIVQSGSPFQVTLGGSHGMDEPIPSYVKFAGIMNSSVGSLLLFPASTQFAIAINPAGNGAIVIGGIIQGSADGHDFLIAVGLSADTPLTNRIPLPNAGPDQTVSSTTCQATAMLNGSGSTDPDGDLQELRWLEQDTVVGIGPTVQVPIRKSGPTVFRLVATDSYLGQAADEVVVTAQLGGGCP